MVIAGFEPLDVMRSALMLIRQLNEGGMRSRTVHPRGLARQSPKGQGAGRRVFELRRSFEWRGLGLVPYSALRIKSAYAGFRYRSASRCRRSGIRREGLRVPEHPARGQRNRPTAGCSVPCAAGEPDGLLHGVVRGACAAYWTYGRFREAATTAREGQRMSAKAKRFPQRLNIRSGTIDMTHGSGGVRWRS